MSVAEALPILRFCESQPAPGLHSFYPQGLLKIAQQIDQVGSIGLKGRKSLCRRGSQSTERRRVESRRTAPTLLAAREDLILSVSTSESIGDCRATRQQGWKEGCGWLCGLASFVAKSRTKVLKVLGSERGQGRYMRGGVGELRSLCTDASAAVDKR